MKDSLQKQFSTLDEMASTFQKTQGCLPMKHVTMFRSYLRVTIVSCKFNLIHTTAQWLHDGLVSPASSHSELIPKLWILRTIGTISWMGIRPSKGLDLHRTMKTQKISDRYHSRSGIRTHDHSTWAGEDISCLRQGSHSIINSAYESLRFYNSYNMQILTAFK